METKIKLNIQCSKVEAGNIAFELGKSKECDFDTMTIVDVVGSTDLVEIEFVGFTGEMKWDKENNKPRFL